MVSINVITDPPSAEVTFNGEIKGISPITIEVELPKTLDDFRDECIGKCGKVDGYVYLPVCEWEVLQGWLESGLIGAHWWELTDDERWCIAYRTASIESPDEIYKYNLPLYDATIKPETESINAIQIKEIITTIDGWLFFSPSENDITPGESDTIPIGSTISIFDGVGDKIVEIDLSYLWSPIFREECLSNESVVCGWPILEERLISGIVGKMWWDLTFDERYSIAYMATSNMLKFMVGSCKREAGCGFGAATHAGECSSNTALRLCKFGRPIGCMTESGLCFWRKDDTDTWHNYLDGGWYSLPCLLAISGGHAIAAIQLNQTITQISDLFLFQYTEIDIQPGTSQLPYGGSLDIYTGSLGCFGVMYSEYVVSIDVPSD